MNEMTPEQKIKIIDFIDADNFQDMDKSHIDP